MDPKIYVPKCSLCRYKESSVAKKKVLSRHGSYLCRLAFVVACSFLSRHIFTLSSSILSRHNLTLSRHSSVDVVCLVSRHKFPP